MNADGTDITRLTDNDAYDLDPSWSPDGKKNSVHINHGTKGEQ